MKKNNYNTNFDYNYDDMDIVELPNWGIPQTFLYLFFLGFFGYWAIEYFQSGRYKENIAIDFYYYMIHNSPSPYNDASGYNKRLWGCNYDEYIRKMKEKGVGLDHSTLDHHNFFDIGDVKGIFGNDQMYLNVYSALFNRFPASSLSTEIEENITAKLIKYYSNNDEGASFFLFNPNELNEVIMWPLNVPLPCSEMMNGMIKLYLNSMSINLSIFLAVLWLMIEALKISSISMPESKSWGNTDVKKKAYLFYNYSTQLIIVTIVLTQVVPDFLYNDTVLFLFLLNSKNKNNNNSNNIIRRNFFKKEKDPFIFTEEDLLKVKKKNPKLYLKLLKENEKRTSFSYKIKVFFFNFFYKVRTFRCVYVEFTSSYFFVWVIRSIIYFILIVIFYFFIFIDLVLFYVLCKLDLLYDKISSIYYDSKSFYKISNYPFFFIYSILFILLVYLLIIISLYVYFSLLIYMLFISIYFFYFKYFLKYIIKLIRWLIFIYSLYFIFHIVLGLPTYMTTVFIISLWIFSFKKLNIKKNYKKKSFFYYAFINRLKNFFSTRRKLHKELGEMMDHYYFNYDIHIKNRFLDNILINFNNLRKKLYNMLDTEPIFKKTYEFNNDWIYFKKANRFHNNNSQKRKFSTIKKNCQKRQFSISKKTFMFNNIKKGIKSVLSNWNIDINNRKYKIYKVSHKQMNINITALLEKYNFNEKEINYFLNKKDIISNLDSFNDQKKNINKKILEKIEKMSEEDLTLLKNLINSKINYENSLIECSESTLDLLNKKHSIDIDVFKWLDKKPLHEDDPLPYVYGHICYHFNKFMTYNIKSGKFEVNHLILVSGTNKVGNCIGNIDGENTYLYNRILVLNDEEYSNIKKGQVNYKIYDQINFNTIKSSIELLIRKQLLFKGSITYSNGNKESNIPNHKLIKKYNKYDYHHNDYNHKQVSCICLSPYSGDRHIIIENGISYGLESLKEIVDIWNSYSGERKYIIINHINNNKEAFASFTSMLIDCYLRYNNNNIDYEDLFDKKKIIEDKEELD